MAKYSKNKISEQTEEEASKIARGIQKPGQSKEQTRLITQGIQKGIDLYKKQNKAKARELDKKLKKAASPTQQQSQEADVKEVVIRKQHWLPWTLLVLSWIGFGCFFFQAQL